MEAILFLVFMVGGSIGSVALVLGFLNWAGQQPMRLPKGPVLTEGMIMMALDDFLEETEHDDVIGPGC